jgi:hypothetical protein
MTVGVTALSYARGVPEVETELAKVTARHLRRAEELCRRRLALELGDQRGNRPGSARFGVSNRLAADVRLAHTDFAPPDPKAFVVPRELLPEQQQLYRAGVAGYVALFGEEPARAVDLGFDTVLDGLEARLVGDVGVAVDTDRGPELRVLRLGERRFGQFLLDDVEQRIATVRCAEWASGPGSLRLVVADVLHLDRAELEIDLHADLVPAREWVAQRFDEIRAFASDPRPRAGSDCQGCRFVAGCTEHR